MSSEIRPGLLVLHGNRLESLRDAVGAWLARAPLEPLEEETFLVQSNGAGEWLKMSLASIDGICAATRVELPARFLWRAYRQMLGSAAVPASSPFEKSALVWRLMRLLPSRLERPTFAPIARFLQEGDDLERRLQLAERVADLYDPYQVYRADWLEAWAQGRDVLRSPSGATLPLPADQLWQAALWRDLLAELSDEERRGTRAQVHRHFLAALASGAQPQRPLPRRVVLFGMSHLPGQTLEALAALARHTQVLIAVPNPCRFHWADIIEGRDLMRPAGRRHALRADRDLAAVPLDAMHAHAHPLLAAWGRQGRDFMRQLDAFDDAERSRNAFDVPRIDLFDEGPGTTMLEQVQASIRDLVPLAEQPSRTADANDRSIVFHIAHNPQREVEVLHDQLLALLAEKSPDRAPLKPRDIVVMVPDIDTFAPAIRAVFGQHAMNDARRIPFGIVDIRNRGNDPLLVALEWLLRAPAQRFRLSEVNDLLEVPAIARRFGLDGTDLPTLARWTEEAGVRWGLDAQQRAGLDLEACGEQNTWAFGLRRMLLGYASGTPFAGIEPYDEIGGLEASLVGVLVDLVDRLEHWSSVCRVDATAAEWAERARALLEALIEPAEESERLTLAALESALAQWLEACELAGFDENVPLAVFREAWLAAVDPPGAARRFLAGGVTFCTLMPLRAVPFQVVCLLGMNDGAYPRQSRRSDFDLMGLPGQQRPGDRSRRDDDRYLMLEALLSARRVLYLSWSGRSARDNSEQPASVLVAQLRDHLRAVWSAGADAGEGEAEQDAVAQRTTEHPLQPFSSRYFEGNGLVTYAREWRAAHRDGDGESKGGDGGDGSGEGARDRPGNRSGDSDGTGTGTGNDNDNDNDNDNGIGSRTGSSGTGSSGSGTGSEPAALPPFEPNGVALTIDELARFVKNPVRSFFRERLGVVFDPRDEATDDDETFVLDGLTRYGVLGELIEGADGMTNAHGVTNPHDLTSAHDLTDPHSEATPALRLQRIHGAGRLPIGETGTRLGEELMRLAEPMRAERRRFDARYPTPAPAQRLHFEADGIAVDDWLDGVQTDGAVDAWLRIRPSLIAAKSGDGLQARKLIDAWVRVLVASACGSTAQGLAVGCDLSLRLGALDRSLAQRALRDLLATWRLGMNGPLPLPSKTALALVEGGKAEAVYDGTFGVDGEGAEPCLARSFPDYAALTADGRFETLAERVYRPMLDWIGESVSVQPRVAEGHDEPSPQPSPAGRRGSRAVLVQRSRRHPCKRARRHGRVGTGTCAK